VTLIWTHNLHGPAAAEPSEEGEEERYARRTCRYSIDDETAREGLGDNPGRVGAEINAEERCVDGVAYLGVGALRDAGVLDTEEAASQSRSHTIPVRKQRGRVTEAKCTQTLT